MLTCDQFCCLILGKLWSATITGTSSPRCFGMGFNLSARNLSVPGIGFLQIQRSNNASNKRTTKRETVGFDRYTEGWHGFLTSRSVFQKPSGFHFAVLSSILSFQLPSFTMTLFPLLIPSRPTVSEWGYFQIARGELPVSLGSMNSAGTAF